MSPALSDPPSGVRSTRTRPDSIRGRAMLARVLREECRGWGAAQGSARVGPSFLRVGLPGDQTDDIEVAPDWDGALAADLVTDLLEHSAPAAVVRLARSGPPAPTPDDRFWETAVRTAAGRLGRTPRLYVLTRRSWWELITDEHRVWTRLRSP